jgi:hypothetical protein
MEKVLFTALFNDTLIEYTGYLASNVRMIIKDEQGRTWNEAVVVTPM